MTESGAAAAPKAKARRGRPPSTSLNRQLILDTALALVEREGPDALTLRRLGTDLGANHTAVLRHFAGKDEILLGLAERLIQEAMEGFVPSDDWRQTLESLARRVRAACLAHPHVAVLVGTRVSSRAAEFRGADVVVGALRRAGFADRDAARYYRSLVDTAMALASYEAAVAALDSASRESDRMAWRREYLAVSPTRYPDLAAVAPYLAEADEDDQFETTLGLILDAVELRARAARR
ncbi:TetR/AcrR family transcriptional regulator C-terminal domain-containing protein [Yinghuangia seranimata]|uniref:TetR/AcrR family transcriptional regulator C-terminal domain-containing protein n=1 Tax=Yinghuangia seranimata TaxID=408067 RepID=UPI00248B88F5|nr:TetR/AcrR family transcriptional regulator C-terminal domain-containing protein [Yinghuangia seranimata]MDI2124983.1 TetR/AcrR family transcriptional regulator C-terminal domain-containing protein [Yinghuangia seranimata]